jgi:hypothetical protein
VDEGTQPEPTWQTASAGVTIPQTDPVTEQLQMGEIDIIEA